MSATTPGTDSVRLRDATTADCRALTDLCFRSKASHGYDERFMEHSRAALTVTSARLAAWRTRVAEDEGGAPLGVAAVSVAPNDATSAELELLFVEPGRMGAGIGSALLADVIRLLVERGVARLWILSDPHAEEFYVRRGAVRVGLAPSDTIPGRQVPWLRLDIAHSAPRD